DRADGLAGQVSDARQGGVFLDQQRLPRDVVRVGEVDLLRALVVGRHSREHEVYLTAGQERDAVGGLGFFELDLGVAAQHLAGDRLAQLDVETLELVIARVQIAKGRNV